MAKTVVKSGDTNQDAIRSTIGAAIDALPNELLALIFTMGAAFEPRWMPLLCMTWHFALAVSSVSRHWRDVAISSRPLWSYLCFTADTRRDTLFANVFLPRSGTHPLEISVRPGIAGPMHPVLKIILPHCARWRTFYARPRDDADLELILLHTRDISVPLLQHIAILCPTIHPSQYYTRPPPEHTRHAPPFISSVPALTSVRLRALCVKCGPSLANLTSFEFDSALTTVTLTQSDMESIVVASPALRVLRLRLQDFKGSGGTITMPSLRDLSLRFLGCEYPGANMRLFASMHAPTLESLELDSMQDCDMDTLWFYCQKWPDYPRPQTLKLFHIHCTRAPASSYDILFHLFPAITSLYINRNRAHVKPVLSQLPTLRSLTYNCMPLRKNPNSTPAQYKYINFVPWILGHVQDCHGTPRAMQSVRIGYSARQNRREEDYQRLRGLVDLVELADEDDSLQESWSSDVDDYAEVEGRWVVRQWGDGEWGDI